MYMSTDEYFMFISRVYRKKNHLFTTYLRL